MKAIKRVLVTGGAGYVGAVLVPRLLGAGYHVRVLDLCIFGEQPLEGVKQNANFEIFKGDIRSAEMLRRSIPGCDAIIHLACISNDPSVDLDPALSRSINYDAFMPLLDMAIAEGVRRHADARRRGRSARRGRLPGGGRGLRDDARRGGARVPGLLHDEARREGDGARPAPRPRDRAGPRGERRVREPARRGHGVPRDVARRRGRCGRGRRKP